MRAAEESWMQMAASWETGLWGSLAGALDMGKTWTCLANISAQGTSASAGMAE